MFLAGTFNLQCLKATREMDTDSGGCFQLVLGVTGCQMHLNAGFVEAAFFLFSHRINHNGGILLWICASYPRNHWFLSLFPVTKKLL